MFFVIGIDQSAAHTGVCILDEAGNVTCLELVEPGVLRDKERLAFIRERLSELINERTFSVGVMEGYSYNSTNKKYILGEVGAVVKLAFYDCCETSYEAAPKQLKKFVTGRGTSDKKAVMLSIEKQWGVVINNDNLADAYGLARIAYEIAKPSSAKRHQLDVLKTLLTIKEKPKRAKAVAKAFKDAI